MTLVYHSSIKKVKHAMTHWHVSISSSEGGAGIIACVSTDRSLILAIEKG